MGLLKDDFVQIPLEKAEFDFFRNKIFERAGISLSEVKSDLVKSRLRPRVIALGLKGFREYRKYLEEIPNNDSEWENFTNLLTTNKTDWFREPEHFNYLVKDFLPKWRSKGKKHLVVWSAACSTGEEVYTLSFVLDEALKGTGITYEILASDIDTTVISHARNGVYSRDRLYQIPNQYHAPYLMMGTGDISGWFKVKNFLKERIKFQQVNLASTSLDIGKKIDLVMCRNVLIYFNTQTIETVVENIFRCTESEAVLIIGHSESLQNAQTSWKFLKPSIYLKGKKN